MTSLNIPIPESRCQALIGTGGIGSGVFFALDENHTLGREESRSGRFLDKRDYCKLHIIAHYVKVLLGSDFATVLVGRVGNDDVGKRLLEEMQDSGLDMSHVIISPHAQTLFSTCFIYPDGSGGNLTTSDSASAQVSPGDVDLCLPQFRKYTGVGIALAAPEVPLDARLRLLELGTEYHYFRVSSLTTAEMASALTHSILQRTDLLSINLDEAAGFAGYPEAGALPEGVVSTAVGKLLEIQPEIQIAITGGGKGSWVWDGTRLRFLPVINTPVVSSAGAGDAFLAGLIVGHVAGLSLEHSHSLANAVAAFSVTSAHTIHPGLHRLSLRDFVEEKKVTLPGSVLQLLQNPG